MTDINAIINEVIAEKFDDVVVYKDDWKTTLDEVLRDHVSLIRAATTIFGVIHDPINIVSSYMEKLAMKFDEGWSPSSTASGDNSSIIHTRVLDALVDFYWRAYIIHRSIYNSYSNVFNQCITRPIMNKYILTLPSESPSASITTYMECASMFTRFRMSPAVIAAQRWLTPETLDVCGELFDSGFGIPMVFYENLWRGEVGYRHVDELERKGYMNTRGVSYRNEHYGVVALLQEYEEKSRKEWDAYSQALMKKRKHARNLQAVTDTTTTSIPKICTHRKMFHVFRKLSDVTCCFQFGYLLWKILNGTRKVIFGGGDRPRYCKPLHEHEDWKHEVELELEYLKDVASTNGNEVAKFMLERYSIDALTDERNFVSTS